MANASDLLKIVTAGIDAVRPSLLLPPIFQQNSKSIQNWMRNPNRFLLALGKASIDSAKVVLSLVQCENYFVLSPFEDREGKISAHVGSHPIPDQSSYNSTVEMVEWLTRLPAGCSLLVLLSGGSSALCVLPLPELSLDSKMKVNNLLIRSGATIQEINTVRKHLSSVKGGQLAKRIAHVDATVLVISDVIGNDLSSIGSGPFYPDPTTFQDARTVLQKHELWNRIPEEVFRTIEKGCQGVIAETPKPGSVNIPHTIIASNEIARKAAGDRAASLGYAVQYFDHDFREDVEYAANTFHQAIQRAPSGKAWIAGGEVTVRLKGQGTGGRNQHLALLMTETLKGTTVVFAAAGTDGIDGNSRAAGAWTDGETYFKVPGFESYLENCDSYSYFESIGQNIITGPTGTNVMDLYVALS